MLSVVNEGGTIPNGSLMGDTVREGARRLLDAAVDAPGRPPCQETHLV